MMTAGECQKTSYFARYPMLEILDTRYPKNNQPYLSEAKSEIQGR